jgi:DNA repair exonuclease SbcCD ATPase subunit
VGTDHATIVIEELTAQATHLAARIERVLAESVQCVVDAEAVEREIAQRQQAHAEHQQLCLQSARTVRAEIVGLLAEQDMARETALANVAEVKATIAALTEQEGECQARDQALQDALAALGARPTSSYADREAVWQLRQQRDALFQQLETEMAKANPHTAKLDALRTTLAPIDYAPVNDLTLKWKHESFLHKLLTAKDSFIRKKIIDQNLSYLNGRLDHYLAKLGLPHEVRFLPDLGVEINLLGRAFDFEQLSRGEMARLTLATCWAFRDVWESLNTRFNLLFLDEMLDSGIDEAGVEAAWSSLQAMAGRNIFVVSHRESLEGRADKVLLVRKEGQFSTFALASGLA